MKLRNLWFLLAGLLVAAPALAADGIKIGFVDMRAVLFESKTGIQFRADWEKLKKDKEDAIRKEEDKLKSMQKSMEKDALTQSASQKQQKQKELEDRFQAYQKMMGDAKGELQQKQVDYQNKSVEKLRAIVADIAKEEKVNAVLVRDTVVYADDGMDFTQKVIQKFDAASKK